MLFFVKPQSLNGQTYFQILKGLASNTEKSDSLEFSFFSPFYVPFFPLRFFDGTFSFFPLYDRTMESNYL